jgi:nucleoside-diphosphate-sugar epimerase
VRRAGAAGAGLPASTYARMGTKGARHCRFRRRAFISDKTSGAKTTLAELARLIARHPEITNAAKKNSLLVWPYNLAKRLPLQDRLLQFRGEYSRGPRVSRRSEAEKPGTFLPGAGLWKLYKSPSRYSVEKEKRELGYRPQIDLERGMELTAAWARWSRLV